MNRQWLLALSFLTLAKVLPAQRPDFEPRTPYGIQDAKMIEALMPQMPGFGGNARDMMQQQSVKPFLMPVRKVGERGDDVAYVAAAALEYYVNRERNFKINLSPDFASIHLRKAGATISLREVLTFLAEKGTVSAAVLPYDATQLTEAAFTVPLYKISNFLHIFRELSPPRHSVFETKKALLRGNPVLAELKVDEAFAQAAGARFVQGGASGASIIVPVLVVSFDETTGAFEIHACRGHEWGLNGYAWMRYDDFEKAAINGYVLLPANP